tara:strand:+ start:241 stop:633 length:393 start_codon:yes stop_codon:yes gene_type:complete
MKIIHHAGKRKTSIAKATMKPGKGVVRVNSKLLENYEPITGRMKIMEPLMLAGDVPKKFNISVKVNGGGWSSQTEAIRLAIGRCLAEASKPLKEKLLKYDRRLLIADTRRKEVCKPNDSKARAKRMKSYR